MRRKTEKLVITSKQKIMSLVLEFLFSHTDTRENELRERIPVPYDNFFKSI